MPRSGFWRQWYTFFQLTGSRDSIIVRMLYSLALYLLAPLLFLYLLLLGRRDRGYRQGWGQRLGYWKRIAEPGGIVVHAVSVGEVNAAEALIRRLLQQYPEMSITITCFTATGSRRIQSLFGDRVVHGYWPLDFPGAVRRFLQHTRPRLVLILETEIWPNFYACAQRRGIPLMLVNARISDRSFTRYQRLKGLTAPALGSASSIAAQSAEDQRRLLALGAPADRTWLSGNLKFSLQLPDGLAEKGQALRHTWGEARPVFLAASTREGEEEVVLAAFAQVREQFPQALLVVVPRHPERFEEVARLITARGLRLARHSQPAVEPGSIDCYLVDAMGELLSFYAACDLAFVGGSLANTGGHNVLEAAALGKPVLIGPNTFNFAEISNALVAAGAAQRVSDAASLQAAVRALLADPAKRRLMGTAGLALMQQEQGALDRTLQQISVLLGNP
ncbi:MAG TPA: lipid IV(A) 3-deoxy-D-manno-octulosonic acid transferase [Xanthomonadales bacterium]|nr:lipid IV(A) 3-deoxy-D-manno-octulosonic acid transferase [Xanthomonadales bacterium]